MAIKYKHGESGFVFKIDTDKPNLHHSIPLASKENYDTVEYQAWLDAGNTPDPAD